jgi:hypothetical protein
MNRQVRMHISMASRDHLVALAAWRARFAPDAPRAVARFRSSWGSASCQIAKGIRDIALPVIGQGGAASH